MRLKPAGKAAIFLVALGAAVGGYKMWARGTGGTLFPEKKDANSVVPTVGNLPTNTGIGETPIPTTSGPAVTLPGSEPGCTDKPEVRFLGYAWNAQMGLHFANGGPQATRGSFMCQHGVNLHFMRQDDNGKLTEALVAFAQQLSQGNPNPTNGAHFVTIMGDGGAAFLKGLNDTLKKLGPDYKAKIVGSCGFSRGEDKFMGPAEWKANPRASMGGFVAGVIRDGDWNIAQKWLGDNGLRTNPDEKTYDPDALNWVNASDYLDAGQKYIAGYSETRPVVRNGRRTGETKTITVNGVVTWTPGDVNVATKKGGLVSIVSTKEYSSQMPCVIIGIDKWMKANRATVEGMLQAIAEGGDAVQHDPNALQRGAEVSAAVYGDKESGPDYWKKYYQGVQESDKNGQTVDLGGSRASNLTDQLLTFGLIQNSANLFRATYETFGNIVVAQYPNLVPNYPPTSEILDTSYLQDLKNKSGKQEIVKINYPTKETPIKTVTSRKAWNIPFETGKATFTPQAKKDLEQLSRDALVASGTVVEIHGHTDNQGNAQANMDLSEKRAFAVEKYLENLSSVNFPQGRIRIFAHGQQNPVAPNDKPDGRARNRRVEVVLGTTGG